MALADTTTSTDREETGDDVHIRQGDADTSRYPACALLVGIVADFDAEPDAS